MNVLLDSLPSDLRAVIEAHYYDELTWEDTGKQLGLTLDQAKKRAKKALLLMGKTAKKRGFQDEN